MIDENFLYALERQGGWSPCYTCPILKENILCALAATPLGMCTQSEPSMLDQLQVTGELQRLRTQKKLMEPLVGDIEANLYVYCKHWEADGERKKKVSGELPSAPFPSETRSLSIQASKTCKMAFKVADLAAG